MAITDLFITIIEKSALLICAGEPLRFDDVRMIKTLVAIVIANDRKDVFQRDVRNGGGPDPIVNQSRGNLNRDMRRGGSDKDFAIA